MWLLLLVLLWSSLLVLQYLPIVLKSCHHGLCISGGPCQCTG